MTSTVGYASESVEERIVTTRGQKVILDIIDPPRLPESPKTRIGFSVKDGAAGALLRQRTAQSRALDAGLF